MASVTIRAVEKPKSFADVKFTQTDWEAATKAGPKTVSRVTAMEALRNSKGLYQIEAEKKAEVEVKIAGMSVSQMDVPQLKVIAAAFGKPIRKQMTKSALREFVAGLIDAVPITDDDEMVSGDIPPSE